MDLTRTVHWTLSFMRLFEVEPLEMLENKPMNGYKFQPEFRLFFTMLWTLKQPANTKTLMHNI